MNAMLPFPDLSPEIFSFTLFGMTVALRWYALAYIVGILVGWRIVVRIWEGGMSFHGGALGVIFAGIAYTKRHGISTISTGDVVCLGLAPGLFLGRLANFINAEL